MHRHRQHFVRTAAALAVLIHLAPTICAQELAATTDVRVMAWNIWHGGREDGKEVGPKRVIEVIKNSGADLVAMQETYGSGELIAKGLGCHFQPRGTNVSIHSRYPVIEDISVHKEFQCVGALVELPNNTRVAFYSIWLPYSAEIWAEGTRDTSKPETMIAACKASHQSLQTMWAAIEARLADDKYQDVPIIIAGDFNSMSHIDYGEIGWHQYGTVIKWPTSTVLTNQGFTDSYRACNPRIDRNVDSTWTPRFPDQHQDRIDFIYHRGARTRSVTVSPTSSRVIREHKPRFPSDHAALLSTLRIASQQPTKPRDVAVRVVSYNIKHGEGMDNRVDLQRTANVLKALRPDFVGLQEVDLHATRSGKKNQANELATMLDMHPGFGSFMDYQGGRYGMAILSRHPIVHVESLRLPNGNEPRVALIAEARLPTGDTVLLVNVHFDWVGDDQHRFAQATKLAAHLAAQEKPFILLGDFNDGPDSRTLALFDKIAHRTQKPENDRLTFSSTKPVKEIDFIFCAPSDAWQVGRVEVITEPMASDHRPVVAELTLLAR
jgi:endonuclease/exonuclease/phosphatase family metal-dependent hydrolase